MDRCGGVKDDGRKEREAGFRSNKSWRKTVLPSEHLLARLCLPILPTRHFCSRRSHGRYIPYGGRKPRRWPAQKERRTAPGSYFLALNLAGHEIMASSCERVGVSKPKNNFTPFIEDVVFLIMKKGCPWGVPTVHRIRTVFIWQESHSSQCRYSYCSKFGLWVCKESVNRFYP